LGEYGHAFGTSTISQMHGFLKNYLFSVLTMCIKLLTYLRCDGEEDVW